MRQKLSYKHIRGHGLEFGALHNPLPVLPGVVVDYVDRLSLDELNAGAHGDVTPVQNKILVADVEDLHISDIATQDFIIANHVIEHCHNPIKAVRSWLSLLKTDGILYMAIPNKDFTFDKPRPITTIEHLIQDYESSDTLPADEDHYREWHYHIDNLRGEELEARVALDMKHRANIHFHVLDERAQVEMLTHPLIEECGIVLEYKRNGIEIIWILKSV